MASSTLTKQALTRLNNEPVMVRLFNGCFNVASVRATFSRYQVELRVEVTHQLLQGQCGNKNAVELVYWQGCDGMPMELPEELEPLVNKLRALATMTDEQAAQLRQENTQVLHSMAEAFGSL
jgi:hypothetical protein